MNKTNSLPSKGSSKKLALEFIFLMGLVSLFGDMTYEGARSITGPYLAFLGASAGVVGIVTGAGEFIGYGLRLVSGYIADRTKLYWPLTIIGYGLLFSIPILSFARSWEFAAFFIVLERMGKAIRSPARDAILSHATKEVGRGFGFGLHEALDQIGAIIGPLIFSVVFVLHGDYGDGFNILWIPVVVALIILCVAIKKVPLLERLEDPKGTSSSHEKGLPKVFWIYTLFTFFSVAGFPTFQLISYHLKVKSVISDLNISVFYAIAMGIDAIVAIVIGKIYDRIGLYSLIIVPLLTFFLALFPLFHGYYFVALTLVFWGAVMGIHETIMRAAIADIIPLNMRGSAYGIFNTAYGLSWFLGSTIMGLLYDVAPRYIVFYIVISEIISLILFFVLKQNSYFLINNK